MGMGEVDPPTKRKSLDRDPVFQESCSGSINLFCEGKLRGPKNGGAALNRRRGPVQ